MSSAADLAFSSGSAGLPVLARGAINEAEAIKAAVSCEPSVPS